MLLEVSFLLLEVGNFWAAYLCFAVRAIGGQGEEMCEYFMRIWMDGIYNYLEIWARCR